MRYIVILSGGLDSSVLLAHCKDQGVEVEAMSFDYGQRHGKELLSALRIAEHYHVRHQTINLCGVAEQVMGPTALTHGGGQFKPMPHGHYAEESMKRTVVPNRNMVMLALATSYAVSMKADAIAYGAHRGDHAIYPDCRPEFYKALQVAISLCDWHPVTLAAPFLDFSKAHIVKRGHELHVPMGLTWSCYEGEVYHCGVCGTCTERKEAFELACVKDPTVYAA